MSGWAKGAASAHRTFRESQRFGPTFQQVKNSKLKGHAFAMLLFEALIQPRVLFGVIPLGAMAYMLWPAHREDRAEDYVDAWYNPIRDRWETPAPWDETFRAHQHSHPVVKVRRDLVHVADSASDMRGRATGRKGSEVTIAGSKLELR